MKTQELTGVFLDYAVSLSDDRHIRIVDGVVRRVNEQGITVGGYNPSTNGAFAIPLMEREKISVVWNGTDWCATNGLFGRNGTNNEQVHFQGIGDTIFEAAMRCYVQKMQGDKVSMPPELSCPECGTCNGHGMIGNILETAQCPDCNPFTQHQLEQQAIDVLEDARLWYLQRAECPDSNPFTQHQLEQQDIEILQTLYMIQYAINPDRVNRMIDILEDRLKDVLYKDDNGSKIDE